MPNTLQDFLVTATQKASTDLVAAFLRLPEDKRNWSPDGDARTALDQMAECAVLNGHTADLIQTRQWQSDWMETFFRAKAETVAQGWEPMQARLEENTDRVIAVIRAVPDADLGIEIKMPWTSQTLAETLSYPYWNMSYHQGQINYLASMLGCL